MYKRCWSFWSHLVPTLLAIAILAGACREAVVNSQGDEFLSPVNQVDAEVENDSARVTFFDKPWDPIQPALQNSRQGSTRPLGWLSNIMRQDLNGGVVGALDELYPGIASDDLYRIARRGGLEDVPEMGDLVLTGEPWEQSIMWWNAETIGNWWDGFVRHAYLTESPGLSSNPKASLRISLLPRTTTATSVSINPNCATNITDRAVNCGLRPLLCAGYWVIMRLLRM